MFVVGNILRVFGIVVGIAFGIWAAYIDFKILVQVAGFWGVVLGLFIPVIIPAVPIYALIAWGDWFPLIVNYGGMLLALLLIWIGQLVVEEHRK